MDEASYLSDPAFAEIHTGPVHVDHQGVVHGRDPAPEQIAAMRLAIRRAYPRPLVGESWEPLVVQVVAEDTFGVRSVDVFS